MSKPSEAVCPICRAAPQAPGFAPFCGRRCADIDLGRWLKGGYAIPGAPLDEAPDGVPRDSEVPDEE